MRKIFFLSLAFCSYISFGQIIDIPDANFKKALVSTKCTDPKNDWKFDSDVDINDDGEISINEALLVNKLYINENKIDSLNGIQFFTNLQVLNCSKNNLRYLDLTSLSKLSLLDCFDNFLLELVFHEGLSQLNCNNNKLKNISLGKNIRFLTAENNEIDSINLQVSNLYTEIYLRNNKLKSIKLQNLPNLTSIDIGKNLIEDVQLFNLPKLDFFSCSQNKLTELILKDLPQLKFLACWSNEISNLKLSNVPLLTYLYCSKNKFKELHISDFNNLNTLDCSYNSLLQKITLHNLPSFASLDLFTNPMKSLIMTKTRDLYKPWYGDFIYKKPLTLDYICTDPDKIDFFQKAHPKAEVNSYCDFYFGVNNYVLNTISKYSESTECEFSNIYVPEIRYDIYSSNSFLGNVSRISFFPFQKGSYKIIPKIENADKFIIEPNIININFTDTVKILTQDICITPKEIFRQTDITILPLTPPARPGFKAKFKVIITNKGNQIESGALNFRYNEDILDYVSADVAPSIQSNGLVSWDFTDLLPFQTKSYIVTLKVNHPTDTPAVNAGDVLTITASIVDNISILKNTVVGSYDPNDKTCLQGDIITPDMVGKYVNYLIRFENTGTYAAENVVVKDIIDESVFDVSSLEITDASHESWARINRNTVEFIFENIQLHFDDANNDGYIAFKIKTKPTLKIGDKLKNKASIYFDYNFPIITNEATSTINEIVATNESITNEEISIYPNPAGDVINIVSDIDFVKVEIFDLSGRLLQSTSLIDDQIEVKSLSQGSYLLKFYAKDGIRVGKMVKDEQR